MHLEASPIRALMSYSNRFNILRHPHVTKLSICFALIISTGSLFQTDPCETPLSTSTQLEDTKDSLKEFSNQKSLI